jgi:hypothetical protein
MNIVVREDLKAYIDPLTPDEHAALERSLLSEGCRDALVLWGDVLVDGHNRYALCQQHHIPFTTVQNPRFKTLEDVHLWMIDQHLGRRSVSDYQRGVLALRKKEIMAQRRAQAMAATAHAASDEAPGADAPPWDGAASGPQTLPEKLDSRDALARAARLSSNQMVMIEKIQSQAAPELVAAVRAGNISINAAAAVASLPAQEQVAAATAGKAELKEAAKRARESRRKPGAETPAPSAAIKEAAASVPGGVDTLRWRVAELMAENEGLRRQVAQLEAQLQART